MVINDLIDNTLNTTSVLGELSQNSYSFTREVGYYSNELYKEVRLITFYSFEDGVKKPLPQNLADELLQLGNCLLNNLYLDRSLKIDLLLYNHLQQITKAN